MKKLITLIGLALVAGTIHAQSLTVVTNQVVAVKPIILTAAQMDGIIGVVQAGGVSANVPINSTNLQAVFLTRIQRGTNTVFVVRIQLK